MHCTRCQGLMVEDQFFDFEGTHGFMWMKGWRCMNCGHAMDPVIEVNHRLKALTMRARPLPAIPVMMVTERDPEGAEQKARDYGAVAFLEKPVKADQLIATIRGVLGRHA